MFQTPYPNKLASHAVYSVEPTAVQDRYVSECTTASAPSSPRASRNIGTGTTSADHTVIESPATAAARPSSGSAAGRVVGARAIRRAITLPVAHDAAAAIERRKPTAGVVALRPSPTTTRPAAPTTTPTSCDVVGTSRSAAAANSTVNPTC